MLMDEASESRNAHRVRAPDAGSQTNRVRAYSMLLENATRSLMERAGWDRLFAKTVH